MTPKIPLLLVIASPGNEGVAIHQVGCFIASLRKMTVAALAKRQSAALSEGVWCSQANMRVLKSVG